MDAAAAASEASAAASSAAAVASSAALAWETLLDQHPVELRVVLRIVEPLSEVHSPYLEELL